MKYLDHSSENISFAIIESGRSITNQDQMLRPSGSLSIMSVLLIIMESHYLLQCSIRQLRDRHSGKPDDIAFDEVLQGRYPLCRKFFCAQKRPHD